VNPKKTTILPLLIAFVVACFALSPHARATCQEGCNGLDDANTFLGDDAFVSNTSGISETAIGFQALYSDTNGVENTAIGSQAMHSTRGAFANTAIGVDALYNNTFGGFNTAIGAEALYGNTTGTYNTATGWESLELNTTGFNNTATGRTTLFNNTTGKKNTATGAFALVHNTTGNSNIAFGYQAGGNLTTGGNNIEIGNQGVAGEANTIRIGTEGTQSTTFIAGISGATVPTGVTVIVDTTGHLGTTTSSARFKENIQPMDKASEVILALKPVTFRYKPELDPDGIPQFGLVAEQVEKVNPDLVARDDQGKPYTVRYEAVNAMLLNEFLKEHRKNEKQEATITRLEEQVAALIAGLQKVSAQLELSKNLQPQTVLNDQ
jgi:endosialidase-like protein